MCSVPGDMSGQGEARLLAHTQLPKIEVLVAGHHGSATSTTQPLLDEIQPETAIISVGKTTAVATPPRRHWSGWPWPGPTSTAPTYRGRSPSAAGQTKPKSEEGQPMPPKKKPDTAGYQKLKKDLADQRPGQLYILHGEETYLRDYYLGRLREQLLTGGMGTFNFHQIEPKDMSPHALRRPSTACP